LDAVHCLHSPSGSPMWNHVHALTLRGPSLLWTG
jgi:hypothetical protein